MKVNFYTFDKKYNSTKRPTGTGTEYNCVLKTSSGVISPTIELQLGLSSNPSAFNYCYISSYARYYWIKEWTFVGHLWIATLNVDVLATWKTYIGSTSMYVYRASAESDGTIIDKKYPTTSNITISKVDISRKSKKFSDGYFVVGVYGDNTNNTTMAYYSIARSNFGTFLNQIFTKGVTDGTNWGAIPLALRNAVFDISSYIKTCKWFPNNPGGLTDYSTIQVGNLTITCPNNRIVDSDYGYAITGGTGIMSIPKHPQARTRGSYCNLTPYSKYKLTYLPFGVFNLDTTILCNYPYMYLNEYIDGITGMAILSVYVCTDNQGANSKLVLTKSCNYAVDIPITVSQTNVPSIASSLAGAGISALHGNVFSAGVSAIASVRDLAIPNQDAISDSMGSLTAIDYISNQLTGIFYPLAEEDITSNGRPLCKVRTPANLTGYIEGESNDFSAPATITEMEEVKQFIDNGFYYE